MSSKSTIAACLGSFGHVDFANASLDFSCVAREAKASRTSSTSSPAASNHPKARAVSMDTVSVLSFSIFVFFLESKKICSDLQLATFLFAFR